MLSQDLRNLAAYFAMHAGNGAVTLGAMEIEHLRRNVADCAERARALELQPAPVPRSHFSKSRRLPLPQGVVDLDAHRKSTQGEVS